MNPPNPQHPGAQGPGGRPPGPAYSHGGAPGHAAARPAARGANDGLDAIPMKKSSPLLIVAIAAGVVVVGGVLAWSVFGGKKTSAKEVEDLKAKVAASAEGSTLTTKEQLEHIRRTRAAMEKYEQDEKQREAEEAAKKQAEEEAEAKKKSAAAAPGGGPAPVSGAAAKKAADSLDSIGADYASKLGGN